MAPKGRKATGSGRQRSSAVKKHSKTGKATVASKPTIPGMIPRFSPNHSVADWSAPPTAAAASKTKVPRRVPKNPDRYNKFLKACPAQRSDFELNVQGLHFTSVEIIVYDFHRTPFPSLLVCMPH